MSRKNLLLLALLVLQVGIIAAVYWPANKNARPVVRFFQDVTPEGISRLVISDSEGKTVTLAKKQASWTAGEAHYPVDQKKMDGFLKKLAGLESNRQITSSKASHSRLKVGNDGFNRKLAVEVAGQKGRTLYLGTSPSYNTLHVRMEGENEVYLAKDFSAWELQPGTDSWWETKYVNLADTEIEQVELTNKNGQFTLVRDQEQKWHLAGNDATLNAEAVQEFLDKSGHITLSKYEGETEQAAYGLAKPVATLNIKTKEKTITVKIGSRNEAAKDYVIKSDASPFYVRVPEISIQHLLEKKAADLTGAPAGQEPATAAQEKPGTAQ